MSGSVRWLGSPEALWQWLCQTGRLVLANILLVVVGLSLRAQEPGFHLEGMSSCALPVTGRKMTNVIFPSDIAAGVRVSRDILVQKVRGVENVIELKALRRDFGPTNLAVYGKDGKLYSFTLHYVEDTAVLDYRVVLDGDRILPAIRLTGWPVAPNQLQQDGRVLAVRRGFLHHVAVADGLKVMLKGVYQRDSLLWLTIELRDRTLFGCSSCSVRIYTESRKKVKRTATQQVDITPAYVDDCGRLPGLGRRVTAMALQPLMVSGGKRLVIEFSDEVGERRVLLKVKGKVLLRARKV